MTVATTAVTSLETDFIEALNWRGEWKRGWAIVAATLVAYVLGATGMFFAFGLFLKPLGAEFQWSREAIAGFRSITGITYAIAAPFVGRLADRFGLRRVALSCAALVAIAFGSQSLLTGHLWHYYALALVMGPAAAGTSALTFGKVISNWFDRSRGMALSILACGSGLGGVVVPPMAQYLISHYGWREAYFLLGLTMLSAGTIPIALVLKDTPSTTTKATPSPAATVAVTQVPRSQVFKSYTFMTLIAVSVVVGVSYVGVLTHLVPMLTDRGMSDASAARFLSLLGIAAIAGHLLIGACFDRFPTARVAGVILAVSGFGVAGIGLAQSSAAIALSTIFLGAALGADIDLLPYLVSRYFSLASYGEYLGYFFAAGTLGSSAGAFLMGRAFDVYHSYVLMTNTIGAVSFIAAVLVSLLPRTSATHST
jgi:predicted MFS family arabinose efflux permease